MAGIQPYATVTALDPWGNPIGSSGQISQGGIGDWVNQFMNYDQGVNNAQASQYLSQMAAGQQVNPLTPGQAAAAAQAAETMAQQRQRLADQLMFGAYNGTLPNGAVPGGGFAGGYNPNDFSGFGFTSSGQQASPVSSASQPPAGFGAGATDRVGPFYQTGASDPQHAVAQNPYNPNMPYTPGTYGHAASNGPPGGAIGVNGAVAPGTQMGFTQPMGGGASSFGGNSGMTAGASQFFQHQFEGNMLNALNGIGPTQANTEAKINAGTDEISEAKNNALMNLKENAAANGGGVGGSMVADTTKLDTDFAGQKANLARDVRQQDDQTRQQNILNALKTAGDYAGSGMQAAAHVAGAGLTAQGLASYLNSTAARDNTNASNFTAALSRLGQPLYNVNAPGAASGAGGANAEGSTAAGFNWGGVTPSNQRGSSVTNFNPTPSQFGSPSGFGSSGQGNSQPYNSALSSGAPFNSPQQMNSRFQRTSIGASGGTRLA